MIFTVKQLAARLSYSSSPEEEKRLMRQLGHWTSSGFLPTIGDKHTGIGVPRHYTVDHLFSAALIYELVQYGLTVKQLKDITVAINNKAILGDFLDKALEGREIFFIIQRQLAAREGRLLVKQGNKVKKPEKLEGNSNAFPSLDGLVILPIDATEEKGGLEGRLNLAMSAIVLNVTKILLRVS